MVLTMFCQFVHDVPRCCLAVTYTLFISPYCPCCSHLLQVRFSTKSFGGDAAAVAAEALRAVAASLEHADMSDIIAGRPVSSSSSGLLQQLHAGCGPSLLLGSQQLTADAYLVPAFSCKASTAMLLICAADMSNPDACKEECC
jgi:hypothetical protein